MHQIFQNWKVPFLSVFSRELYIDVARNWRGTGLGYLFLLLCLTTIPLGVSVSGLLDDVRDNYFMPVIEQLPELQIEQGVLKTDVPQPFVIRLPGESTPTLVIDTRARSATSDAELEAPVMLQSDRLIIDNQGDVRTFLFQDIDQYRLDKTQMHAVLDRMFSIIKPLAYVPLLCGEFIYHALQALIYAVGGLVFCTWLKTQVRYRVLLRLTCVAMTPSILLGVLLSGWGASSPWISLLLFLVVQAYLFFAIQSIGADPAPDNDDHFFEG